MSKVKLGLLCYSRNWFKTVNLYLLPYFLSKALWNYTGVKWNRLVVISSFFFFFPLTQFIMSKKIGSIHRMKQKGSRINKSKKKK